jgi:predicted transcriptional regulator
MVMKRWTDFEIASLKKDYMSFLPRKKMIKKYQRSWNSIQAKANSLKLFRGKPKKIKRKITIEDIVPYIDTCKSYSEIARKLNCSYQTVINRLKEENKLCYDEYRRYPINEHYFDNIDCQEKAYIIGLLYADGYNNTSKGKVVLSLHYQDSHILKSISKLIQPTKPLFKFKKTNLLELTINSKHISKRLSELGIVKKKALILKFPDKTQIPEIYYPHFIRGYFDGDGCISITKRKTGYTNIRFNISGTKNVVENIQKVLINNLNLNKTVLRKIKNTYVLEYSGRNVVKKIKNYLYKDAVLFFDRKKEKFDQL